MDKTKRPQKEKLWLYADPSVRLPYFLIRSNAFRGISHTAKVLYVLMRMSVGDWNYNPMRIRFGPQDAEGWMNRNTYYAALKDLLKSGIIIQVEPGTHGRKGVYDITTLNWTGLDPPGNKRPRKAKPKPKADSIFSTC